MSEVFLGNIRGPQGPMGPQGLIGGTGGLGPQGPMGPRGATGPEGPRGKDAATPVMFAKVTAVDTYVNIPNGLTVVGQLGFGTAELKVTVKEGGGNVDVSLRTPVDTGTYDIQVFLSTISASGIARKSRCDVILKAAQNTNIITVQLSKEPADQQYNFDPTRSCVITYTIMKKA